MQLPLLHRAIPFGGVLLRALRGRIAVAHRRKVSRQSGFALLVVTVTVAILGAVVGDFGFNARIDLEAAVNGRDQLRAEYLARSGINLARLLIKVQQAAIDPVNRQLKMDIQVGDFAPVLAHAFGGGEGADDLASMLGLSAGSIKGLGVGKGASFDMEMGAEDGKINVNCGGGLNAGGGGPLPTTPPPGSPSGTTPPAIANPATGLYSLLAALVFPPRYNRLFDSPDADGQYATRDSVSRAIIDWSDVDDVTFDPLGAANGSEDYRYDALRDPYLPHNNYYDTVEEVQLAQGVGDDFWGTFGDLFTVYGRCKVNLGAIRHDDWPITAAIIRAAARDTSNPVLLDDVLLGAMAQQIGAMAQMVGGYSDIKQLVDAAKSGGVFPMNLPGLSPSTGKSTDNSMTLFPPIPGAVPVELDPQRLAAIATVGPREIYRLDSTGVIERTGDRKVAVHIRAVFDTKHFNQNTVSNDPNDRIGTWVYWRVD